MKYNKGDIMRKAHSIRKANGYSMSYALQIAWAKAKIEAIKAESNGDYFTLQMKDGWSIEDQRQAESMTCNAEIRKLALRIWEVEQSAKLDANKGKFFNIYKELVTDRKQQIDLASRGLLYDILGGRVDRIEAA